MSATGAPIAGSTWKKLRRRKVVQWGLGYVAVAWGIVQAVAFAVGTFHWPELLTRVAAVVAVAGLPLTLVLAWFHGDRGQQRVTRAEFAILSVVVALGALAVVREVREANVATGSSERHAAEHASARLDRHRIAILPFDNLGSLAANAAFVGGVHDTLITQVAKIPGLSVISRSSVLQYADKHPTIAEVAAALGVGTVLEGSVEREGDRLRIQTQLIDARTDTHVWAETYDRTSDDLFAVQSEIAQAVAEQLRIHLTGADSRRLNARLTSNAQAYEHYVLGRNYVGRVEDLDKAIQELTTAITLDPTFAAAYAYLSLAYTWQGFLTSGQQSASLKPAWEAAGRALELDPTLPEGHLAMAAYFYRGAPDIARAAKEFELAIAGLPNDAFAYENFGWLRRWQGRWEEAAVLFRRAAALDPRGPAVWDYILALISLGREEQALKAIAAAAAANPQDVNFALGLGEVPRVFSCDLTTQERVQRDVASRFADSHELLAAQADFALTAGDAEAAVRYAERHARLHAADDPAWEASFPLALAYRAAGRQADSDRVSRDFVTASEGKIRGLTDPDAHPDRLVWMGVHFALLGDEARASDYVNRALKALPSAGDAANRNDTQYAAAIAFAWDGDTRGAVQQLEQVLSEPTWRKPAFLWCDPYLAPLRTDAGFRKLLADRGANLSIDPRRRETWPKH